MKTFSRATYLEATQAWIDREFGPEWTRYRLAAAERGFVFPPDGTRWDQREDETPSQRAIIHAAIEDTPQALMEAIETGRSWFDVVHFLIGWQDARAATIAIEEQLKLERKASFPSRDEAELTYLEICRRIGVEP